MTTAVTVDQLRNLADRAATGLTPDEQQRLRDGIDQLHAELEHARTEANRYAENESADIAAGSYAGRVEELEELAEQHARNTLTVARERETYRAAWKEAQRMRAKAEQRADRAEAANDRVRRLAARIRQGVPWASNFDNLADRILSALDGEQPGARPEIEDLTGAYTPDPPIGCLLPDQAPPDEPVWTPPPPGDRREQLPDQLLALIDIPDYLSTACEAATLLARQMPKRTHRRVELGEHSDRLHARCRLQNKFTGVACRCDCHTTTKGN